jgi:hypothetical protein
MFGRWRKQSQLPERLRATLETQATIEAAKRANAAFLCTLPYAPISMALAKDTPRTGTPINAQVIEDLPVELRMLVTDHLIRSAEADANGPASSLCANIHAWCAAHPLVCVGDGVWRQAYAAAFGLGGSAVPPAVLGVATWRGAFNAICAAFDAASTPEAMRMRLRHMKALADVRRRHQIRALTNDQIYRYRYAAPLDVLLNIKTMGQVALDAALSVQMESQDRILRRTRLPNGGFVQVYEDGEPTAVERLLVAHGAVLTDMDKHHARYG